LAYGTLYGSANFQNDPALLLAWGKDNSNQIDVSARGRCGAANCGQWNWSLSAGSVLKGVLPQMNNGQACPAALNGATEYLTYALTREFLIAAIEIAEDRVGNDNGICESGESCIYARSIGVDQGSGSANQTCSYSGSANLAGITIYGY
jgi:hypothetical protein